jgi:short-subunit dehydrogenase
VDCLINDAGFGDHGDFATADLAKQERMISVNITALTALTRLFCRLCWKRDTDTF